MDLTRARARQSRGRGRPLRHAARCQVKRQEGAHTLHRTLCNTMITRADMIPAVIDHGQGRGQSARRHDGRACYQPVRSNQQSESTVPATSSCSWHSQARPALPENPRSPPTQSRERVLSVIRSCQGPNRMQLANTVQAHLQAASSRACPRPSTPGVLLPDGIITNSGFCLTASCLPNTTKPDQHMHVTTAA